MPRRFDFYCNLSNETVGLGGSVKFTALLLSISRETKALASHASTVVGRGMRLSADNGNATAINRFIAKFEAEAARLDAAWRRADAAQRSGPLRQQYRDFAAIVRNAIASSVADADVTSMVRAQRKYKPSFFVCHEDYTLPVMLALGIEAERLGFPKGWYVGQQLLGIEYAARTARGEFGPYVGTPYATLHAVDYDSAYDVGFYAGLEPGIGAIATGVAGFMNDPAFITSYDLRGETVEITGGKSVPRRYLRALQVVTGLRDGFRDASGKPPDFHALGLGAPIMLPLLTLALDDVPALSVDSTAPIKNANMGKVMLDDPAYVNGSIEDIANDMLTKGFRWTHRCASCAAFLRRHPFRYDDAISYHRRTLKEKKIRRDDLAKKDGIGKYLPYLYDLSALSGGPLRKELHAARIGHNHAVLLELTSQLHRRRGSKADLRAYARKICFDYKRVAEKEYPPYALQIDECLRFIDLARGAAKPRAADAKAAVLGASIVRKMTQGPRDAVVGLEKTAIVAAVGAYAQKTPAARERLAAISAAAWRAMRAADAAARQEVPEEHAERASPPASAIEVMSALRDFADVAEPLASTGTFLVTPGGQKADASVEFRKDAERIVRVTSTVRQAISGLAESLDGTAANVIVDYSAWEKWQASAGKAGVPDWLADALEAEGCTKEIRKGYAEWFAKYFRKRVKPQKLSYLFRISYFELRKAAGAQK